MLKGFAVASVTLATPGLGGGDNTPAFNKEFWSLHFERRAKSGTDTLGLGFFVRRAYRSIRYGVLVTEIARNANGEFVKRAGVRPGMVVSQISSRVGRSKRDIVLRGMSQEQAFVVLHSLPPPFDIVFRLPGDCLLTLQDPRSASYDEALFFQRDAGGPYVFFSRVGEAKMLHKLNDDSWALILGQSMEWAVVQEAKTNEFDKGKYMCYGSLGYQHDLRDLDLPDFVDPMQRRGPEIDFMSYQPGHFSLSGVGKDVATYKTSFTVAVCAEQVIAWLKKGWLQPVRWNDFDRKHRKHRELRQWDASRNIYAECDPAVCDGTSCASAEQRREDIIVFQGDIVSDVMSPCDPKTLADEYRNSDSESVLKDYLDGLVSRCKKHAVVIISFRAHFHPALREGEFTSGQLSKQEMLDNSNPPISYGLGSSVQIEELRDGGTLGGFYHILGPRRRWGRVHRNGAEGAREWVPLTSWNGSIRYAKRQKPSWQGCTTQNLSLVCNEGRKECLPWWALDEHDHKNCPYGARLLFEVTRPSDDSSPTVILAILYAYVPVMYAAMIPLSFLCNPGTRTLSFILFILLTTAWHEGVVKRIVSQPRPTGSCNTSCGMPSSHACMAVGYLVLCLLDSIFRTDPEHEETWLQAINPRGFFSGGIHGPKSFAVHATFWCLFLLPVPMTRVVLRDHTPEQVLAGSLLGVVEAVAWTLVIRKMQKRYPPDKYRTICGLRHNYGHSSWDIARARRGTTAARAEQTAKSVRRAARNSKRWPRSDGRVEHDTSPSSGRHESIELAVQREWPNPKS